jgi:hypothetical protein
VASEVLGWGQGEDARQDQQSDRAEALIGIRPSLRPRPAERCLRQPRSPACWVELVAAVLEAFCDALFAELSLAVAGVEPALLEELPVDWPLVVAPVEVVWAMATDPSNSTAPTPPIKIFFFMTKSPASLMD